MKNRITSYVKVGANKGQRRIWLESKRLEENGFAPGEAFRTILDIDAKTLTLEIDLFGDRRVCSRKRKLKTGTSTNSIVDLCSSELTDFVGDYDRVRVDYFDSRIVVTLHHEDVARIERESRLKRSVAAGEIHTGTLCAGAGISTAAVHDGLMRAGLNSKCNWMVDSDQRYLEIADRNNHAVTPETQFFVGTVEELESDLLTPVDLLNVSLPCDIHASCGKAKKGLKVAEQDSSITSVFGLISVLRAVNPSIVVSENVVEASSSTAYMMIRAELRRLGYVISESILDEQHGGALETRRRYWFVAVSSGLGSVNLSDLTLPEKPFKTVSDVLDNDYLPEFRDYEYLDAKERRDLEAGKNFRQNIVTAEDMSVGTMGKGYAKVRSTEPRLEGEEGKTRLFSVTEACRMRLIPEHLLGDCGFTLGHEAGGQSILYEHGSGVGMLVGSAMQA